MSTNHPLASIALRIKDGSTQANNVNARISDVRERATKLKDFAAWQNRYESFFAQNPEHPDRGKFEAQRMLPAQFATEVQQLMVELEFIQPSCIKLANSLSKLAVDAQTVALPELKIHELQNPSTTIPSLSPDSAKASPYEAQAAAEQNAQKRSLENAPVFQPAPSIR